MKSTHSYLSAALLGTAFGVSAQAIAAQGPAFWWPSWGLAGFLAAGAALGLLWASAQAAAWRLAFGWEPGWGLSNGARSLLAALPGFLAPWAVKLKLPPPHDQPLRALAILLAAQGILVLAASVGLGLWRLRKDAALRNLTPRSLALRLGGMAALVYLLSGIWVGQWNNTGDAPHYAVMTQSLVQDQDFELANDYSQKRWRAFYDWPTLPPQVPPQADGRVFAEHKPGVAALLAPGFYLFGFSGARWVLGLLAGLGVGLLFLVALSIGLNRTQALLAYALLAFSAPWWTHSQISMAELPGGLCLLLLLAAWRGVLPRAWGIFSLLALPWLSVRYMPLAAFLGAMDAYGQRQQGAKAYGPPLLAVSVSLALAFAYNAMHFGGISPVKAYEQQNMGWSALVKPWMIPRYVSGLLLDQENGWLPYAPAYTLAFFGLRRLWLRDRQLFWQTALPATVYLLPVASFPWWGSAMAPNRFLICLAPFFALWTVEAWRGWRDRTAFRALAGLSFVWAVFLSILPWFSWSLGTGQNRLLVIVGAKLHLSLTPWFPAFMVDDPKSYAWPVIFVLVLWGWGRALGRPKA